MKQIRTNNDKCDTCKHGHRGVNQYPCDECQRCNWAYYHSDVMEELRVGGSFNYTGQWEMQVPDDT